MDAKCHRRAGASGQATVEHVGMVVVVALLLAAAGAWASFAAWALIVRSSCSLPASGGGEHYLIKYSSGNR